MAILASYDTNGNLNVGQLNENLAKIENLTYQGFPISDTNKIKEEELDSDQKTVEVKVDGYTVKINGNGTVTVIEKNEAEETTHITASVVAKNPTKYYGKDVYVGSNNLGAKILYADNNNIYIIRDWMSSGDFQENEYTGLEDITDPKLQELNKQLFSSEHLGKDNNRDMRRLAYMMDTEKWNNDGIDAPLIPYYEFAIASPTIEMLLKSYNQKYGTNYQTRVSYDETNKILGYEFKKTDSENWTTHDYGMFNQDDELYIPFGNDQQNNAYWIASPTADASIDCFFSWDGQIDDTTYAIGYTAFYRPVICLKSDVELELVSDGELNGNGEMVLSIKEK